MFFTISLEATQNVTTEFGVLCLGIFVGGILAFSLSKSDGNLKTAIAIIGAALGGTPMLFIEDVGQAKWVYPVGLILGLLILRFWFARSVLVNRRSGRNQQVFAWGEVIIISILTVLQWSLHLFQKSDDTFGLSWK